MHLARASWLILSVTLGRLQLRNPVLVASGTFGYAREMAGVVDFARLGGVIPKTVTRQPRAGNPPPRTVETPSGMLNAIGLDNDGIEHFLHHHLPYLRTLPTAVIANIAGKNEQEFVDMAEMIGKETGLAALELNLSCPNVSGGVDFAVDPEVTRRVVQRVRDVCPLPLIAKLTPNVTRIAPIAQAAADGGADAVSLVNTFVGMAVDWRRRRPVLGNVTGGLSGPAIKPLALRLVWQTYRAVKIPIIGVGGIATLDDVMEFLVAGATRRAAGHRQFLRPYRVGARGRGAAGGAGPTRGGERPRSRRDARLVVFSIPSKNSVNKSAIRAQNKGRRHASIGREAMTDSAGPDQGLERFRAYLTLLSRAQIDPRLQGKIDLSGVVQQTLLEAHLARQRIADWDEAQQAAWLRRLLAHNLTDEVRKLRTEARDVQREQALDASSARLEAFLAAEQSSPSEQAQRKETALQLADALERLPPDAREALVLQHWHGWTLAQIAERLGRTPGAVAGLIHRGLQQLKKTLGSRKDL